MKKTLALAILTMLAVSLVLAPPWVAQGTDEEDDEAAYRALRGEAGTDSTDGRNAGTTPSVLSKQAPAKLNTGDSAGPFFLVAIDQFDGSKDYRIMTSAEIRDIKSQLSLEAAKIRPAYTMAQDEWKASEQDRFTYPCPKSRQVQATKKYVDREDANKKRTLAVNAENKQKEAINRTKQDELKKASEKEKVKIQRERAQEKKMSELFLNILGRLMSGEASASKATGGNSAPGKRSTDASAGLL